MAFFHCEDYEVLDPNQYKNNPLYGRNAMEITHECPTELLLEIIKTPLNLGHASTRQANRMTIVACNAALEYDYRVNGIDACRIDETLQERIIKTAVKLLKKDLPMRPKSIIDLYTKTILKLGIADLMR